MGRRNRKRKGAGDNPASEPNPLQRANVPDEWERGGEVDEVEAALVSGAGGETSDVSDEELERQAQEALGRPGAEREVEADVVHFTNGMLPLIYTRVATINGCPF